MKLAFPNGEREDFAIGKGSFSIGNSDQDDIVINGGSGRAILTVDQRGITLSIDSVNEDEGIRVNSRPVREKAILRLGDHIQFGSVDIVLRSDPVDYRTPPHPFEACDEGQLPAKILLRGIDGIYSGKVFPVKSTLTISSSEDADVVLPDTDVTLTVGCKGDNLYVRRESGEDVLDVNGYEVKHAELKPGDQVAIGRQRFLIETPGFVPGDVYGGKRQAGGSNTQVFSAKDFNDAAAAAEKEKAKQTHESKRSAPKTSGSQQKAQSTSRGGWNARDAVIIGICVALSAGMLVFIFMNL